MLQGVMLLWFLLTALSVAFVAFDIRSTPESPVLKWGFVLLTLYTGPIGAFAYVLGCREPLAGTHERYVAATWRQVLGSTMHCVAGDGLGIIVGAVIAGALLLRGPAEIALEYALGFGFGWSIFQALFMRQMVGGSFIVSLRKTLLSEFLSMNLLMTGMLPVAAVWRAALPSAAHALRPEFWFAISTALLFGFILAYPMNWWLVTNHLKHGMLTVRKAAAAAPVMAMDAMPVDASKGGGGEGHASEGSGARERAGATPDVARMAAISIACLAAGVAIALIVAP